MRSSWCGGAEPAMTRSESPTATRLPAWSGCTAPAPARDQAVDRLPARFDGTSPSLSPTRSTATATAGCRGCSASARCARKKARANSLPTSRRIWKALPSSPGRAMILTVFEAELARLRDAIAVTSPCRCELAVPRRRQCADRAVDRIAEAQRLHDPRHQRRPLSRARPPAAAGRRHLHPRENDHRQGRLFAEPERRAALEIAGGDGPAVRALAACDFRYAEFADSLHFSLDELRYEYPQGDGAGRAARRSSISSI